MKEIRICWHPSVVHDDEDRKVSLRCNQWSPLNIQTAREMELLCNAANQVYGPESHWNETRPVPGTPDFW